MANDLINLIPKDAEELATFIEAVQTIRGASKAAKSAVAKHFGPAFERNWRRVTEKAKELRDKVAPERHTEPSPSILIPLVDAACQEGGQELQDLWAALLANSMIDGGKKVRREYLEAVRRMEPMDVSVLNIIRLPLPPKNNARDRNDRHDFHSKKREEFGITQDEWAVSVKALTGLGCMHDSQMGYEPSVTAFARMLLAACEVR